jgi:simple sugar transport system permease protein
VTDALNTQLDRLVATLRGGGANLVGLLLLLFALFVVFTLLLPGTFLRLPTMQAMMFQLPELGLLSLAMVIPLVSGGLNLAIIATTNQAALLMAWILTTQMPPDALGGMLAFWVALALAAGFLLCLLIGVVTGLIVAITGVHPILVTLGTQTLIGGISIWLTRGRTLTGFPDPILFVSNETFLGIPYSFIVLAIVALAAHVLLTRMPLGVRIHMIGSNLEATRYSGVDTKRVHVWVYVSSSLLCWLAAIIMMGRFNSAGADIAQSYLLITILAAILGGINPYGGFGRISGLVVSLAILQTISSGFNLLGFSQHLTLALWGLTLLAVMAAKRIADALNLGFRMRRSQSNGAVPTGMNQTPEKST